MTSIGASYAALYMQQKRQKEKKERIEKKKGRRGESNSNADDQDIKVTAQSGRNKKVHPGNSPALATTTTRLAEADRN